MHYLKLYAALTPIALAIDFLWIGVLMKSFYLQQIGDIARREGDSLTPRWIPAILVYVLIPAGIIFFVRPMVTDGSVLNALGRGALFGLTLYGLYDLTNYATLEKWTLPMTLVDMAWGATLCAILSVIMTLIDRWLR